MKIPLSTKVLLAIGTFGAALYVVRHYEKKLSKRPTIKPQAETKEAASG
jgi:hypothetical protein